MLAGRPDGATALTLLLHAFEKRCMTKLVACGYCDRKTRTGLHVDRYRITPEGRSGRPGGRRVTAVRPMNHPESSKAIDALGLAQVGAARFLGVDPRTCRRYVAGELPLPPTAAMLLRVMLTHGLAPDDVGRLDGRSNRSRD